MTATLPAESEINVYDTLDERVAVREFLGKSLEQARDMFRLDFLYYEEWLMWMGPRAFHFYLPAAIDYLMSNDSSGDSNAANTFLGLIQFKWEWERDDLTNSLPLLQQCIGSMLQDFGRFQCDPVIYGDLETRYRELQSSLAIAIPPTAL